MLRHLRTEVTRRLKSHAPAGVPSSFSSLATSTFYSRTPPSEQSTPYYGAALAAMSLFTYQQMQETNKPEACGIVGVISQRPDVDARSILLEGLTVLQNRGYDSAGMATYSSETGLIVTKYASLGSTHDSIDLVKGKSTAHVGSRVGIAHTRSEGYSSE